jgi:hypothetical protein
MTKKTTLKRLQTKAGKLWKEYCKKRDVDCVLCHGKKVIQVHHIFSRKIKRLFLDVQNGVTLCSSCHCKVTWDDSYRDLLRRRINSDTYDMLYEISCDKSLFLEWKDPVWLQRQIDILTELKNP